MSNALQVRTRAVRQPGGRAERPTWHDRADMITAPRRRTTGHPAALRLEVAEEEPRWTAACARSGQPVTAFHTWAWLHAGAAMTGADFVPLVLVRDGVDLGVVPVLARRRGPFLTVDCVPFPYCGPLVPTEELAGCLDLLKRYAGRSHLLRTVIQFPPGGDPDEQALSSRGFTVAHDATYVLDTTVGVDALWSGLASEARRRVRHTEKNGITLIDDSPAGPLDTFQDLTFAERGLRSGYVGKFSDHLDRIAGPDLRVHQATAVRDGEVLGVLVTLASSTEALGWMGGVFPMHRSTHASYRLYWDAIRWAAEIGVRRIDLVGVVNEGIGSFKKQFGGTLESYTVAQLDSRAASAVYQIHGRLARSSRPR